MSTNVDTFFEKATTWQPEMMEMRRILLSCGLIEELKWNQPCYSFRINSRDRKGANIAIIGAFKDFCVMAFFKGIYLSDVSNILVQQGANTQSTRVYKCSDLLSLINVTETLKESIYEAIELEKENIKISAKDKSDIEYIEELIDKMQKDHAFSQAFTALTPGRQRGYNIFFAAPKQSKTRVTRIEKYTDRILSGKGIHDCTCGLSKRMPNCDGSHNQLG